MEQRGVELSFRGQDPGFVRFRCLGLGLPEKRARIHVACLQGAVEYSVDDYGVGDGRRGEHKSFGVLTQERLPRRGHDDLSLTSSRSVYKYYGANHLERR